MNDYDNLEATRETSRLLSELDLAIDHSSVIRNIVDKSAELRNLESITGPSRLTRIMRKEIQVMESKLRFVRSAKRVNKESLYSPT
jgi:hypothetical protein